PVGAGQLPGSGLLAVPVLLLEVVPGPVGPEGRQVRRAGGSDPLDAGRLEAPGRGEGRAKDPDPGRRALGMAGALGYAPGDAGQPEGPDLANAQQLPAGPDPARVIG